MSETVHSQKRCPSINVVGRRKNLYNVKAQKGLITHTFEGYEMQNLLMDDVSISKRAPCMGPSLFERIVGSVKRCLRKVSGNARLTFDELLSFD